MSELDRRNFLKSHLIATSILASTGLVQRTDASEVNAKIDQKKSTVQVDVMVIGGGSAGHVAAIQAARMGASTILLERNSQLGAQRQQGV